MIRSVRLALAAAALAAAPIAVMPLAAQAGPPTPPVKPSMDHGAHGKAEHGKAAHGEAADHHAASGWKEIDAYHGLMMATWHPARGRNDLAPLRSKATEMVASAKLLAASTPPKGCTSPALKSAAAGLEVATAGVAALVARHASDAELRTALAALHEKFEVLESGCVASGKASGHGQH